MQKASVRELRRRRYELLRQLSALSIQLKWRQALAWRELYRRREYMIREVLALIINVY
jgi:hypothetical protein